MEKAKGRGLVVVRLRMLAVRGNLEALLTLTGRVESVGSPGGILALVTMEAPVEEYRLWGRHRQSGGAGDEQRRAAGSSR